LLYRALSRMERGRKERRKTSGSNLTTLAPEKKEGGEEGGEDEEVTTILRILPATGFGEGKKRGDGKKFFHKKGKEGEEKRGGRGKNREVG